MTSGLLRFLLYLPAIYRGTTLLPHPTNASTKATTNTRRILLEDVSLLLASCGVTDLCHPTSDRFSPLFPKCTPEMLADDAPTAAEIVVSGIITTATASSSAAAISSQQSQQQPIEHKIQRRLENEEDDQMERLRAYYAYEDDAVEEEEVVYVEPPKSVWFYVLHVCLTLMCTLIGAVVSGLYIGLLSIDPLLLVIKSKSSEGEKERKGAIKVLALVKQRHQLIVTLLVVNCASSEAMPIFLENLVHESVAILISVVLVLLFGEILPTVFFTGPDQIQLASRWAPIVRFLMFIMYPIAAPIAYLLEVLSSGGGGDDESAEGFSCGTMYNRGELATLIRFQYEERRAMRNRRKTMQQSSIACLPPDFDISMDNISIVPSGSPTENQMRSSFKHAPFHRSTGSIDSHDVNIMEGALQLKTKTAMDVFLSFHKVFCVPHDMVLDETNIFTIYASGYSRVPVYVGSDRRCVKGILLTRQLMVVKRSNNKQDKSAPSHLSELSLHTPHCVGPETNLSELINLFQKGCTAARASHMAMVCGRPSLGNNALQRGEAIPEDAGLMGIITLEDVLEALLQEQIYDEMDAAGRANQRDDNNGGEAEMDVIPESSSYHVEATTSTSYHELT